jgi:hypothetical protein
LAIVALGAAVGGASSANAQAFRATAPPPAAAIDSEAVNALEKMGAYLRTLNAFQVRAEMTTENVLPDGQKVQIDNTADLVAKRPNALRLEVTNNKQHRRFLYDGKTFTLYAPRTNHYASVSAPPTIVELAERLETTYGIELPFVDLFRWGTSTSNVTDLKGAIEIGTSVIDGVTCTQYAFRQNGVDWQIWIQDGDYPLPRKLVITSLTDDARPQTVAVYTWNLAPSFDSTAFTFEPPKDAMKIKFADVTLKGRGIKTEEKQ